MEYSLIVGGIDATAEKVRELIADGWRPHGSPFVVTNNIVQTVIGQAMTREKSVEVIAAEPIREAEQPQLTTIVELLQRINAALTDGWRPRA